MFVNPKERAIAALSLREPEGILPAFELEFQLTDKREKRFYALWDNGSSESFIRRDLAKEVATISKLRAPKKFEMGKGTLVVKESTPIVDIEVEGYNLFWHFLAFPDLSEELIIGADFRQRWKIKFDPENESIIIDPKALKLKL
jgi:hypothetical protein